MTVGMRRPAVLSVSLIALLSFISLSKLPPGVKFMATVGTLESIKGATIRSFVRETQVKDFLTVKTGGIDKSWRTVRMRWSDDGV